VAGDILQVITLPAAQLSLAVNKDLFTTKGDIAVATAPSVVNRFGAGNNGEILRSYSTATSGLEWATKVKVSEVLAAPTGVPTGTPSSSGGTITADTYLARVTGLDSQGLLTGFGSESLGVVTTGSTSSISWSWTAVTGAASYIIVVKSTSSTDYTYYFTSATSTFTQTLVPSGGTLLKFEVGASNGNATGGLALTGGIKFNPPGNIYSGLVLANNSITEVNQLRFNDAGANEGLIWDGGNGWRIFESPNDVVTNGAGNLQITQYNNANGTNTRRATFTSGGGLEVVRAFSATTKSFDIEHPTKDEMRLRYGSLEGPENGVYVRGTTTEPIIELPDYWTGLVHEDSITVSLTAVGSSQNIYITEIKDNKVYIGGDLTKAFFTVYGERKDVDKLTVEY
jgi:hypothetical protein